MNNEKIGLQTWKERFIKIQEELYKRDSGFPVMPLMISTQAMLGYIQFTMSLIDEKLEAERKEYDMRDYESHSFSADQERIRNGEL